MTKKIALGLFMTASAMCGSDITSIDISPATYDQNQSQIKILDQKELKFKKIADIGFSEASDLAYDSKSKRLYMVGDEGILYVFDIKLGSKINSISPLYAKELAKKSGSILKKKHRDSEGLTIDNKGTLIVSFEGSPRIESYNKTTGHRINKHTLPSDISSIQSYQRKNKTLESVAYHSEHGILTAPEKPLQGYSNAQKRIYSLSGKSWGYLTHDGLKSSITAIEVMDDGNLLILERTKSGKLSPITITLRKLYLDTKPQDGWHKTKVLSKMSSKDGWRLDNFEGLSKVGDNKYLMISDNNDNFFQKSILIYFEVVDNEQKLNQKP